MPIIAKRTPMEPAPAGIHQAVCVDVVDEGDVVGQFGVKHKISIWWQSAKINPKNQKPWLIIQRYTLNLHPKSALTKLLANWRGRPFGRDEMEKGIDVESMIGENCLLNILHQVNDETVYANVESIMPLADGMRPIQAKEFTRQVDKPGNERDRQTIRASDIHTLTIPANERYFEGEPAPPSDEDVPF